ncbi:MAG TPA: DUF2304 domain-containing protein [Desulfuromonadales bacterium]|nr:DUF2304 domain-containing protein [Desulfuromonadales bacterium]
MPFKQQVFSLLVCVLVFVFTVNMVRTRRLHEEYSVLWLTTSVLMFVLVLKYDLLVSITNLIGAGLPTTTLFICANVFLVLIAMQFSFRISKHSDVIKNLVQENALLREELDRLKHPQKNAFPDEP